jgi:thiamine biosynthesis protein ThiS
MDQADASMRIWVNGEPRDLAPPMSVRALLDLLGIDLRNVAVERNKRIVRKPDFDSTELADGDRIEIVTLVGGG